MQRAWPLIVVVLGAVACARGAGGGADAAGRGDEEVLTDTVVTLRPDGTFDQTIQGVTRRQRLAELQAPAKGAVANDRACAPDALWLYDQPGNRLCIRAVALGHDQGVSIELARVKWSGRVTAIWPGLNQGEIYDPSPSLIDPFAAWGRHRPVDPASSRIVYLAGPDRDRASAMRLRR